MNQPLFGSGFNSKTPHIKHISVIKRTQKESDQEANTNSGRNLSKQNS
jgi:hypothetical protein